MTITPDQADRLKRDATDGPWMLDQQDPDEVPMIMSMRVENGTVIGTYIAECVEEDGDARLIAAAPDMAETIAGMEYDYGIQQPRPEPHMAGHLMTSWGYRLSAAKATYAGLTDHGVECHIVRRLVSAPEVIDGE